MDKPTGWPIDTKDVQSFWTGEDVQSFWTGEDVRGSDGSTLYRPDDTAEGWYHSYLNTAPFKPGSRLYKLYTESERMADEAMASLEESNTANEPLGEFCTNDWQYNYIEEIDMALRDAFAERGYARTYYDAENITPQEDKELVQRVLLECAGIRLTEDDESVKIFARDVLFKTISKKIPQLSEYAQAFKR